MDGNVMNVDRPRQKPEKNIADDLPFDFGKDRAGASDLQLLAKKAWTPRIMKSGALDHHDFVQVGRGDRPKSDAVFGCEKLARSILRPQVVDCLVCGFFLAIDGSTL